MWSVWVVTAIPNVRMDTTCHCRDVMALPDAATSLAALRDTIQRSGGESLDLD